MIMKCNVCYLFKTKGLFRITLSCLFIQLLSCSMNAQGQASTTIGWSWTTESSYKRDCIDGIGMGSLSKTDINQDINIVTGYCDKEKIGSWYIRRVNDCDNRYSYSIDGEQCSSSSKEAVIECIQYIVQGMCDAGKKKPEFESYVDQRTMKSLSYAKSTPINIGKPTPFDSISTWYNLGNGKVYKIIPNDSLIRSGDLNGTIGVDTGDYQILPDTSILIFYRWEKGYIFERQKISCSDNSCVAKRLYRGNWYDALVMNLDPEFKDGIENTRLASFIKDSIGIISQVRPYSGANCLWMNESFGIGETTKRKFKAEKDSIEFTCTKRNSQTYWSSAELLDPIIAEPKEVICLDYRRRERDELYYWSSPGTRYEVGSDASWRTAEYHRNNTKYAIQTKKDVRYKVTLMSLDDALNEKERLEIVKKRKNGLLPRYDFDDVWRIGAYLDDKPVYFLIDVHYDGSKYSVSDLNFYIEREPHKPKVLNFQYDDKELVSMDLDFKGNKKIGDLYLSLVGHFIDKDTLEFEVKVKKKPKRYYRKNIKGTFTFGGIRERNRK